MRGFALGLSLSVAFIIGCLAGPHLTVTAEAQTRQTYRYVCVEGSRNMETLTRILNVQGGMGRELIAVDGSDGGASQWCFRIH